MWQPRNKSPGTEPSVTKFVFGSHAPQGTNVEVQCFSGMQNDHCLMVEEGEATWAQNDKG
jgi:hypothetical protein